VTNDILAFIFELDEFKGAGSLVFFELIGKASDMQLGLSLKWALTP